MNLHVETAYKIREGVSMRKIVILLCVFFTGACSSFLAFGENIPKQILLARRYKTSPSRTSKAFRDWQDNIPKTRLQIEREIQLQEDGLMPAPRNSYDKFLEEKGYRPRYQDNYQKRRRGVKLKEQELEDEQEDPSNPVSIEPYNILPNTYENRPYFDDYSAEENKKESTGGHGIDQQGQRSDQDENQATTPEQEEDFYNVNELLMKSK